MRTLLLKTDTARRRRDRAFTLVELLVVIAIISLLVSILVPTVQMAIRQAHNSRSRARIHELFDACVMYHKESGYYPGQQAAIVLDAGAVTGSQWLGWTLFFDPGIADISQRYPQPKYAPLKAAEDIIDPKKTLNYTDPGGGSTPFQVGAISDRMPLPLPVLYYPARLGVSGMAQYKEGDNALHVQGNTSPDSMSFTEFIRDRRFKGNASTDPANPGGFLLIGAGLDRKYFTADDICYPDWRNR